ncbi:MAG TPA: PAS domain S-box protein, partial [Methanomicrobiales archaeon]|nr:PAS domain S-box protein [Methanomicrobiales archaeon]
VDAQGREVFRTLLGRDVVGLVLPANGTGLERLSHTAAIHPPRLDRRGLKELPHRNPLRISEELASGFETVVDLYDLYVAGLSWNGAVYGNVNVFLHRGEDLKDESSINSFLNLSSMALRRKTAEEILQKSEQQFRDVADLSPYPLSIIDRDGQALYINRKFTEVFGYTIEDVPNGRAWFSLAFPNPEYRKRAIFTWKSDLARASVGEVRTREFTVRCKYGEWKQILFRPVTLADGNQYITYEDITHAIKWGASPDNSPESPAA